MRKSLITGLIALVFTGLNAEVGLNFNAEFLWWKANPDNQFVNFIEQSSVDNSVLAINQNDYYSYGWDPGYKVGVDYAFCLDNKNLDLFLQWTHFQSSHDLSVQLINTAGLLTIDSFSGISFNDQILASAFTYQGNANFCYNRLDTGIAANYFQCNNLSISPSWAFTYLHIKNNITDTATYTGNPFEYSSSIQTSFNGYGITIGANAHCSLTHGFFIYNKTDLSALYGQNSGSLYNFLAGNPTSLKQKTWNFRFVADLELGVEYFTCLFNCLEVSARVGYEFVYMPDMAIISQLVLNDNPDNININGVVAGLQIGFY